MVHNSFFYIIGLNLLIFYLEILCLYSWEIVVCVCVCLCLFHISFSALNKWNGEGFFEELSFKLRPQ